MTPDVTEKDEVRRSRNHFQKLLLLPQVLSLSLSLLHTLSLSPTLKLTLFRYLFISYTHSRTLTHIHPLYLTHILSLSLSLTHTNTHTHTHAILPISAQKSKSQILQGSCFELAPNSLEEFSSVEADFINEKHPFEMRLNSTYSLMW